MRLVLTAGFLCVVAATVVAAQAGGAAATNAPDASADVTARVHRADKVVVAVVEDVTSRFGLNQFGDRLIVSDVWLRVEETLKGLPENLVPIEMEGGTIGDLTLRVSDLPALQKGERGVFLLDSVAGKNRPHARGKGILRIDAADYVGGTGMRVSDLKASIKASQK